MPLTAKFTRAINLLLSQAGLRMVRSATVDQLIGDIEQLTRERTRRDAELIEAAPPEAPQQPPAEPLAIPTRRPIDERLANVTASCVGPVGYATVLEDVMAMLTDPAFAEQDIERQVLMIQTTHGSMMATGHAQAGAVGLVAAPHVRRLLRDPRISLSQACRLNDSLYQMWWISAASLDDMRPMYAHACLPFHEYLERRDLLRPTLTLPAAAANGERPLRIGYLFHYANGDRGNSVAPLMTALAKGHDTWADRTIFAYAVQAVTEGWLEATFGTTSVTTRSIPQWQHYEQLAELYDQIQADEIDVIVSDSGTSITNYLFGRRAAPIQLWIDMGQPYLFQKEYDLVLQAGKRWRDGYPGTDAQSFTVHLYQAYETLFREPSAEALAEARSKLPPGRKMIGVFTRLCKITPDYLAFARDTLLRHAQAHLLVIGTGDPRLIEDFAGLPELVGRVSFINHNVDLAIYARVIDIFLDTFPFIGAITCREIQAHGIPIASLRTHEWDILQTRDRDPHSIAEDLAGLERLVDRLLTEPAFHAARSDAARAASHAGTDIAKSLRDIEAAIEIVRRRPSTK